MPSNAGTHRGARLSDVARSISSGEYDEIQHLMECRDKWCSFCRDEEPERDPEVQAWLDAIEALHSSPLAA